MTGDQLAAPRSRQRAARIEDLEFMAATGETVPGAAARLRLHPATVRTYLTDAGRRDVWARLLANQDDRGYTGPRVHLPPAIRRTA